MAKLLGFANSRNVKPMSVVDHLAALGAWIEQRDEALDAAIDLAGQVNPWFVRPFCELALQSLSRVLLDGDQIRDQGQFNLPKTRQKEARTVGVVLPGKAPLAGIRDVLAVALGGHKSLLKLAADDEYLWIPILRKWQELDPKTAPQRGDHLKDLDAIIFSFSGSNEDLLIKYFNQIPHFIGKQEKRVVLLNGTESSGVLRSVIGDVLNYYGLGPRAVTHVMVPEGFKLSKLLDATEDFRHILKNTRYRSNLDFYLARAMLNRTDHLHNDVLALVESEDVHSPTGILHYSRYATDTEAMAYLQKHAGEFDTLVTDDLSDWGVPTALAGTTHLWSLADVQAGRDISTFLANLQE